MSVRIQLRRDTKTNWETINPILASGEIGIETDTGRKKIGNGTDRWTLLDYDSITRTDLDTKQDTMQFSTLPEITSEMVGMIAQYIGSTTSQYTNGFFYIAEFDSTTGQYKWIPKQVQTGGGGGGGAVNDVKIDGNSIVDGSGNANIPIASNTEEGVIRIATDAEIITGTDEDICINAKQMKDEIDDRIGSDSALASRIQALENEMPDKEDTSNKTTTIDSASTDTQYPSAKAVYDAIQSGGGGVEKIDITNKSQLLSQVPTMNLGDTLTIRSMNAGATGYQILALYGILELASKSDTQYMFRGGIATIRPTGESTNDLSPVFFLRFNLVDGAITTYDISYVGSDRKQVNVTGIALSNLSSITAGIKKFS